jgi:LacI family transcriptional regulator
MTRRGRLTIREVAEAAGVSTQTVSRVINDRPDVAPDTYERVQRVIAATGYAPNMLARGLTQGRTNVLGVVAYGLEYVGPSRILTGIDEAAADLGYSISLDLIHRPETGDVDRLLNSLFARQVDGIVWAIPEVGGNRTWSHARSPGLLAPVVLVGGMAGGSSLPSVCIDNHAIGELATRHLVAGGARSVGIVTGPLTWWEAHQRLLGWRETLRAHGLAADDARLVEGDWTAESGEHGLYELLRRRPEIDSVFASNDQMALGILHAAHRLGRRVPDDLAVVGVDDIAEGSHFWPPLTTVHQPLRDAGAIAVQEADRLIRSARNAHHSRRGEEPPVPQTTLLEPELVVRDSSRPVARAEGRSRSEGGRAWPGGRAP